jgi:hypothetical protein
MVVQPAAELAAQDLQPTAQVCLGVLAELTLLLEVAQVVVVEAEQVAPVRQVRFKSPLVDYLLNII